ncbi:hypothetical protein MMC14_004668 [Varicellaria rhodocarpa]|nr:hypothetical protein [Varicellaria rhodocarpa]
MSDFWSEFRNNPQRFMADLMPGLPQPGSFPTASEVRREAREFSKQIFADWTILNKVLERYEEVLRKRWTKKTQEQRKKILLEAWPNLSSAHRPDFEALHRESANQRAKGTKFLDAYLWPYINLEDLAKWKPLLLLLNARGRHLPDVFAHADYNASQVGETSGATRPAFLNEYTMLLNGKITSATYGQLVAWNDDDEAYDLLMSGIGFQPGMGLQVLKTQQRLLRFLVQCCHLILHDLPSNSWVDASVQPEPPISVDETEWPSLASVAAEAPYRVPARLEYSRLQAIIAAKRSAAEDHIWALREDPNYFVDTMVEWSEHQIENMKGPRGIRNTFLNKPLFWDRVLASAVSDAYETFITWDAILQQMKRLTTLNEKYSRTLSSRKTLPPEFAEAFHSFRYFLNEVSKDPIEKLKTGFPASPPVRPLLTGEINSTRLEWKFKSGAEKDYKSLFWIFSSLSDEQQCMLCGSHNLVDEFERLTQIDRKQKEMITPWVAQVFSDLSVIVQTRQQLSMFHPSGLVPNNDSSEIIKSYVPPFSSYDLFRKNFHKISKGIAEKVGNPSDRKFYYPSNKRRTQQNTEDMQAAENNLDTFWQVIDQHLSDGAGKSLHKAIQHLFTANRQIQRTSDWTELSEESKEKAKSIPSQEPYTPFSTFKADLEARSGRSIIQATPLPSKPKTRGTAHPTDAAVPAEEPERHHQPDIQPVFTVSKRALKVFSTLFHQPSHSDTPGEVAWPDFLHAMAGTGFTPEKLYGSVWQFTPTNLDVERSIQFHEPHPHGKIPFTTARRHGRRLNRAYGWTGDMFTLRT